MITPVISRQRIIDHGEVFTPPGLVNDMLNLVAQWWLEEEHGDVDQLADQLADLVWSGISDGC